MVSQYQRTELDIKMKRDIQRINDRWHATRPERGEFAVLPLARSWGWVFKPREPVIDNHVGFQDGFDNPKEALQHLRKFLKQATR